MKQRIISGIILALIILPFIILGGNTLRIGINILGVLAFRELINIKENSSIPKIMKVIGLLLTIMLINYSIIPIDLLSLLLTIFLLLYISTIFISKNYHTNTAFKLFGIITFIGFAFNRAIEIYNSNIYYFILLILVGTLTDIFALFGGKLLGKHHFTKISPNKTIEGCIIGSTLSVVISTIYYYFVISNNLNFNVIFIILILSILGQIGDLFFSKIKRENELKIFLI